VGLHDVETHAEAETGALTGGFGGEEGLEDFLFNLRRDAGAVVGDLYCDGVGGFLGGYFD